MDARDRLRQYLEQRSELGESEYVLDSLSVEDALKSLGMRGELPTGRHAPPSDARHQAERLAQSGDWREALRAVGAERPGSAMIALLFVL